MGRYTFSAEEIQRRADLSSQLKKKSLELRKEAGATAAGPKKEAADDSKKLVKAAPKVDLVAMRRRSRDRRNFLMGTAAFGVGIGITTAGSVRLMYPRILFEPPSSFDAGRVEDYLPDTPFFWKEYKTWIVRAGDRLYALSGRCTHLGCTPAWLASDAKFKCPCHGSGFRMTGVNFEGPAPRPLERFKITLVGGKIMVDKSKMFFFEKAQWDDPESFLTV